MFLFSLFLFHFFFQHFFSLSSLLSLFTFSLHFFCSSLRAFSPIFFSLFSPFFLFVYLSVSLSPFSVSHVSLSVFSPSPFLRISSFVLDLVLLFFLLLYLFFLHQRICFLLNKFKIFLIFELSFLLCFVSCFSSLRHPYSLSLPCFTGFQRFLMFFFLDFLVSIFFSGLVHKFFAWLLNKKNSSFCLTLIFLFFFFSFSLKEKNILA